MPTGQLFVTALQEVAARQPRTPQAVYTQTAVSAARLQHDQQRKAHVYAPRPAALAVPAAGPTVTPLPKQVVQDQAALFWRRQEHHGSILTNRWSGYHWVSLPPVTPTPKQVVINDAVWTAAAQQNRARSSNIYQPRTAAEETFATPTRSIVIGQAEQTAIRRSHHGSTVQNRWPGYQWVGLPPVTPTPRQVVQDQAAIWQARQDHRRGTVIAPPVQQQASAGTGPPPFSGPLPRQTVILARATPRQPRIGHVTQPRMIQAPVTPPRPVIIDLCPATLRRARGGHIITGRPLGTPVTPPRQRPIQTVTRRRQRRGGIVRQGPQLAVFGAVTPPSTLITTPLTGYVSVGSHGYVATGDTGQPPAGSTAPVKTGDTGFPTL